MKRLVVYYSRTGNNRKIAQEISGMLEADIDEIVPERPYSGFLGFMKAGYHAIRKKTVKISSYKNPSSYLVVVIVSPLNAGSLPAPVRSYVKKNEFKKLAFFSCCGRGLAQKSLGQLRELNAIPVESSFITEKEFKENIYHKKVGEFCELVKKIK